MRILFVAPRMPHRKVWSGHQIVYQRIRRLLDRGHEVGLACFLRSGEEHLPAEWRGQLADLETVADPTMRYSEGPRKSGARLLPLNAWKSPEMTRRVGDLVERSRYDVAIAEFTEMGRFLHRNPYLPAVRKVMSVHQCLSVAIQNQIALLGYSVPGILRRFVRDRVLREEFRMYRSFDRVTALTPQERFTLQEFGPELRTALIPVGVDTDHFRPPEFSPPFNGIVFTGYYQNEANCDAVRWFVAQVWPRVRARHPDLFFYVVGPQPPPDILNLAWKDPMIVVTGEVEDVRPYLAQSAAFVCPIRMGSGIRLKILEAMAYELPVVTTSLGAEGLPILPGQNGMIADHAEVMAQQINVLLDDARLRAQTGRRARATVVERYSWDRSVQLLEDLLLDLTEPGRIGPGPSGR